jgi:hypothetical protein
MGTKENPGRFDCHAKAEDDEPLFTLLARDVTAPFLVQAWAAIQAGNEQGALSAVRMAWTLAPEPDASAEKIAEAVTCAQDMVAWRERSQRARLQPFSLVPGDPAQGAPGGLQVFAFYEDGLHYQGAGVEAVHETVAAAVREPPPPPWPPGNGNNAKRAGWEAYFKGKPQGESPFPVARRDLADGYRDGWEQARRTGAETVAKAVGEPIAGQQASFMRQTGRYAGCMGSATWQPVGWRSDAGPGWYDDQTGEWMGTGATPRHLDPEPADG